MPQQSKSLFQARRGSPPGRSGYPRHPGTSTRQHRQGWPPGPQQTRPAGVVPV